MKHTCSDEQELLLRCDWDRDRACGPSTREGTKAWQWLNENEKRSAAKDSAMVNKEKKDSV
jgi:hypothetical protein